MLPIAGETAGPNGLKFYLDTRSWVAGRCFRQKKSFFSSKLKKNSTGNAGPFS